MKLRPLSKDATIKTLGTFGEGLNAFCIIRWTELEYEVNRVIKASLSACDATWR